MCSATVPTATLEEVYAHLDADVSACGRVHGDYILRLDGRLICDWVIGDNSEANVASQQRGDLRPDEVRATLGHPLAKEVGKLPLNALPSRCLM